MNSYGSRAAFEELSPDRALDGLALPSGAVPEPKRAGEEM